MKSKTTPKDFFLHVGATIALYVSAVALMNLIFAVINRLLPDALDSFWSASSIVWPVSMLVVLVPILYVVEFFILRDIAKIPEKKEIWVRRWRIYATLFLTALTLAGDLIALINVYLNGEITERFIWKALTVFVVSGIIFAYYVLVRIGSMKGPVKTWRTALAWVGGVVVVAAIAGGFIIVGSPAHQRALRFDGQRVSDLMDIQSQVLNYWQADAKLPGSLQDLNNAFSGFNVPTDPETGAQYQYVSQGTSTFELCASFDLPSAVYSPADSASDSDWTHSAGNACFTRNIDQKLYPPAPQR